MYVPRPEILDEEEDRQVISLLSSLLLLSLPVLHPVADVLRAITPSIRADAVLLAFFVASIILRSICPCLDAMSILQVVSPPAYPNHPPYINQPSLQERCVCACITFILGTIDVKVSPLTISFIILPLTFEDVTVNVPKLSCAMRFAISPFTYACTEESTLVK